MTAIDLKRFFKTRFGIKVRARAGKGFCTVVIPSRKRAKFSDPLIYDQLFPASLGNQCMRIVYSKYPSLCAQDWGGNVSSTSISMAAAQWEQLFALYKPVQQLS